MTWRRFFAIRRPQETELNAELVDHLERHVADSVKAGLSPQDARRRAFVEFGGVAQTKEACRDARGARWRDEVIQDLRVASRTLKKAPLFAIVAIVTMAIGIGATTAAFSVVYAVLLKPLPFPEADRLVSIGMRAPDGSLWAGSPAKFGIWQHQPGLQGVSAFHPGFVNLTAAPDPEALTSAHVSVDWLTVLGARFVVGRSFSADEDRPGGAPVVVLSYGLWQRRFGGDRHVVGQSISLDFVARTIVGVLAQDFDGETLSGPFYGAPAVWIPLQLDRNRRDQGNGLMVVGRLGPGITIAAADSRMQLATDVFRRTYPGVITDADRFGVEPLRDMVVGHVRPTLLILFAAVSLVLLIGCTNVASLLLARALTRRREIAIRVAIGAGRARIIRQLLVESLLLALTGGLLGSFAALAGTPALVALRASEVPRLTAGVAADGRVLLFALMTSVLTGVIFGLLPALRASRIDLVSSLKQGGALLALNRPRDATRTGLVVAEIAFTCVLTVSAALLIRSLMALRAVDPGFDAHQVVTMQMSHKDPRFTTTAGVGQLITDGLRRVGALPGVVATSASYCVPLQNYLTLRFTVVGRSSDGTSQGSGTWGLVSPEYFDVYRIPLRSGRLFTEADHRGAPAVVIINETLARRYWPNGDALGHELMLGRGLGAPFDAEPARQIVGIVGDVHEYALDRLALPTTYVPITQLSDDLTAMNATLGFITWSVRTHAEPRESMRAIGGALQTASGGLPPARSVWMEDVVRRASGGARFNAVVCAWFGATALLLAAIGLYGLMAQAVQARTREIGIRLALGASTRQVRNMVVAQGLRVTALGIVMGLAGTFAATRALRSLLFGVTSHDPLAMLATPLILAAVALVSMWLPARRTLAIEPVLALRCE